MTLQPETQTSVEGKSRKRLKPLLQKLLNDNSVPGLCWRDRGKQIWQMPWKCHRQTRWGDPDALMLRELAKGMYNYEGANEPAKEKLKHWKELLRNALRSLKDVKELKDLHVVDGEKPYKVYQFVDESEGARRCRSSTACQATDTERPNKRMLTGTVGCNNSSESFSNSTNLPRTRTIHEQSSRHQALPATISSQSLFSGISFQGKSTQLVNAYATCNQGLNVLSTMKDINVLSELQHQGPPLANPVNEDNDIFAGNLADICNDETLNKLMSEFALDRFRSRSPLNHDNVTDTGMDIHEISIKDIEIFNNRPQSTTGVCNSPMTTTVSSLRETSSYDMDQPCTVSQRFAEATVQNMAGNDDHSNAVNPGFHVASVFLHRQHNVGNTAVRDASLESGIQNMAVQNQPFIMGNEILPAINPRCITSSYVEDKSVLTGEIYQKCYTSITSLLRYAPVSSVIVSAYYNTNQAVKWQICSTKFRICFVPDDQARKGMRTCTDPMQFGPTDVDLFELPEIRNDTGLSLGERNTNKILCKLRRGVIVDLRNRDIYATRYCNAVPQFQSPGKTEFIKMERHQEVKIFDFCDYFKNSFDPQYQYQNTNPFVRLSFSVTDVNRKVSALSVDIWHAEAYQAMIRGSQNAHSLEADCSLSDKYDRRVETDQLLKATTLHF